MTKLRIPDGYTEPTVTNLGAVYFIENGKVEIPQALVHDGLFAAGFTVAPDPEEEQPLAKKTRGVTTETFKTE